MDTRVLPTGARILTTALILLLGVGPVSAASNMVASDKEICDVSADAALGIENYPTAIRLHLDVLRSHPGDALAHYHLGFAYAMVGRREEELREYRTAAALGLQRWDLYLNLGLAYLDRGELNEGATSLEQASLMGPEQFETHYNLALVYEKEGRLSEALQQIALSRKLQPRDLDAGNTNAIICVEMGDLACAREIWMQQLRESPEYRLAQVNLSVLNRSSSKVAQSDPLVLKVAGGL
jgi:Flp pilus assembly protein TadD